MSPEHLLLVRQLRETVKFIKLGPEAVCRGYASVINCVLIVNRDAAIMVAITQVCQGLKSPSAGHAVAENVRLATTDATAYPKAAHMCIPQFPRSHNRKMI